MRLILYQLAQNSWERKKICIVKLLNSHLCPTVFYMLRIRHSQVFQSFILELQSTQNTTFHVLWYYCSMGRELEKVHNNIKVFRWKTTCLKCKTVWKPSKYHEYCSALCSVYTYIVASLQLYLNFHVNISFHLNKSNEWTASKSFMLLIRMDKHTLLFQWIQWASIKEVVTLYLFNI